VTDDEGRKVFALVNKATGQAMMNKHKSRQDGLVPASYSTMHVDVLF